MIAGAAGRLFALYALWRALTGRPLRGRARRYDYIATVTVTVGPITAKPITALAIPAAAITTTHIRENAITELKLRG